MFGNCKNFYMVLSIILLRYVRNYSTKYERDATFQ